MERVTTKAAAPELRGAANLFQPVTAAAAEAVAVAVAVALAPAVVVGALVAAAVWTTKRPLSKEEPLPDLLRM